ncbi:MAG: ATP-binding protein [Promethearchaeota archaeon]
MTIVQEKELPVFNRSWCKSCGICVEFCPRNALAQDEMGKAYLAFPKKCNSCRLCELRCPELAIELRWG